MTINLLEGVLDPRPEPPSRALRPIARDMLFFDLETVPDESRLELYDLDPLPHVPPETEAENMPAPEEVISASLAEVRQILEQRNPVLSWLDQLREAEQATSKPRKGLIEAIDSARDRKSAIEHALADRSKRMATDPEMCRIVAFGFAVGDGEIDSHTDCDERDLLLAFWEEAESAGQLCGFNILGFDLPVILARSAMTGIVAGRQFDMRPWGRDVLDLMLARFPAKSKAKGLKTLAKLYGIDAPAGDCEGSQVERLVRERRFDELQQYVESDVHVTRELYRKWRGLFC